MLILTRKIGECIAIGDHIWVCVVSVRGKQVRLGIEAPPDVLVRREEICQQIVEKNRLSTQLPPQSADEIAGRK